MKNITIAVLVLVVAVESYLLITQKMMRRQQMAAASGSPASMVRPGGGSPPAGKPVMVGKGQKLAGTPMAQYTHKIFPEMAADAKSAMTGFEVTTVAQSDGSTLVTLMPKDSDDQKQEYVVTKGNSLYFVEMTPADDNADSDKDLNYRDDYGIILDVNGIIQ